MFEWLRNLAPILLDSLVWTELFELIMAALWGIREERDLILVLLGNLLTNPLVVFFHYLARHQGRSTDGFVFILEIGAVLIEGLIYDKAGRDISYPYFFSICANIFSYALGMLLSVFF